MCGIAGILSEERLKRDQLSVMLKKLSHRGPDETTIWGESEYLAGMRRLSINDIEGGSQPLFNSNKNLVLFYNGEIYNYPSLRKELEADGIIFNTNCDGEVISHLYEKYGEKFLSLLDGMFAISIWDTKEKTLLLARDYPGEKPLYYSKLDNGGIAFSSEIESLSGCNLIDKNFDSQSIWDFPTFLWIPEPNTIYKKIKALMPGQYLKVNLEGRFEFKNFKSEIKAPNIFHLNQKEKIDFVRDVVEESIRSRLLSDVPIGSFLSGGLDSSIITSVASKYVNNLKTFCIGFKDKYDPYHGNSDESEDAAMYAAELGIEHFNIKIDAQDFRNNLPQLIKHAGQPYAVSSGLGILSISKLAKELGVKVLLSGDGADEAFGGYSWYKSLQNISKMSKDFNEKAFRFYDLNDEISEKQRRISKYKLSERQWSLHYYGSENEKSDLFSEKFKGDSSLRYFDHQSFDQPLDYLNHDRDFYFPNEMLSKVDRFTMANSVEGRAPFAAPNVQLLAKQLKWDDLYKDKTLKWILRKAFDDNLPRHIIKRKKHGFNVPIDFWLKHQWNDLLEDTFSANSKLMRLGYIDKNSRLNALKLLNDPQKVSGHIILCYIMLNIWLENLNK